MRALLCVAVGCGGGDGPKDPTGPTGDDDDTLPPSSTLVLDDRSNFAYAATCGLPHADLVDGADFAVDWSGLSVDLYGRPFDPALVRDVVLSARTDTPADIAAGIADETLDDGPVEQGWHFPPDGATAVTASQMLFDSHPFEPADWVTADQTFLLALLGEDLGLLSAATASGGGGASLLALDDSAVVDWTATLGATALSTRPDLEPWTLDWSGLAHDSFGRSVDPLAMEQLFVARLDASTDVAQAMLDLEGQALEWYVKYVAGLDRLDAAELLSLDGDDFEAFTLDGTWVVGFRCSACGSRVPRFAAIVRVVQ